MLKRCLKGRSILPSLMIPELNEPDMISYSGLRSLISPYVQTRRDIFLAVSDSHGKFVIQSVSMSMVSFFKFTIPGRLLAIQCPSVFWQFVNKNIGRTNVSRPALEPLFSTAEHGCLRCLCRFLANCRRMRVCGVCK